MNQWSIVSVLVLCSLVFVLGAVDVEIENKNCDISLDISSQLVKASYKITLEHRSKKPITSYSFLLLKDECEKLSFISARDSAKKDLKLSLSKAPTGECTWSMTLTGNSPNPVVYIETVFAKALKPFPSAITQAEKQLVQYFGNAYFYSPFKTTLQKTTVHLASRNVESFTLVKPASHSDTTITYGPYDNIPG